MSDFELLSIVLMVLAGGTSSICILASVKIVVNKKVTAPDQSSGYFFK